MSQNVITLAGPKGPFRISAGWDNPLQEVFCNVFFLGDEDEDDEDDADVDTGVAYRSSFCDGADIAGYVDAAFGVKLPQPMLEAIDRDIADCARNVLRQFDATGTLLSEQRF